MSIYKGNKKVVALYKGATPIIRRYKGTQLIFDATPSDVPTDTLSFAWSGTSATMQYKINGTTYTASTNPYSATLSELGITDFTNANTMFNSKRAITAVTSIPDTSNVTDMYYMFRYLGVSELEVTKTMNTSACTNMSFMFAYCPNLTSLDLSSFDTSKVTNMQMMFYNSQKLDYLDLSGWDLRNVTSKSGMFGNGCKPSTIIMNGCDCDTILFIRQEIQNNGVDHTKVVQTDTVCLTYETYSKITYTILKSGDSCAYNEYIYPSSVIENTDKKDKYGVTSNTSSYITNYTVKFQLQENGESVEGDNETGKERVIVGIVYYNDEYIGEYVFTQKAKPTDSGGSSNTLSCNFNKSTQITDLYFDMDNLPEENGYWWVGFSFNPNQEGDCNNCNWSNGDLRISLFENRYDGIIMNGEITNLEQVNGLYHLHLNEPLYFICGEANAHLERYYLKPDKSAPCGDTISFTSESSSQSIIINNRAYDFYNMNDYTETDGKYVFNKSVSELTNGDINSSDEINSMRRMFNGCSGIISINNLPCTSNVDNMSQMFYECYNLTSLDLSSFDTSNVTDMSNMFYQCYNLTSLNLSNWTIKDDCNTESMFSYCNSLNEIYLKNSDNATYMKIEEAVHRSGINATIITE